MDPVWDVINIYDGEKAFLLSFSKVRRETGLLYASHLCQSEVCNGGFGQFFSNSTGVLAPEAIEGFRAIGQLKVAAVIDRACAALGLPYPRDREARQGRLKFADRDLLNALNLEFYDLIWVEASGFLSAADSYAIALG